MSSLGSCLRACPPMGSAWKVNDEAATTFANAFYNALLPAGDGAATRATIGESVRRARRAIVEEHGEGEPAWAGYALYGSPWKHAL
jgi:CHAT domain-containing protein